MNGPSRFGWITEGGNWQATATSLVSDGSSLARIATDVPFADFDLRFEARVEGAPASVVIRVDPNSKPAQPGVHIHLADGAIDGGNGDASQSAGAAQWRQYEVKADGDQVTMLINGKVVASESDRKNRIGAIQFEAQKDSRLEVRAVLLKPLDLDKLYNGSNLDGWKALDPKVEEKKSGLHLPIPGLSGKPKPPKVAHWAGDGSLHGSGGGGQLETARTFQDFVLQLSAKATSKDHGDTAMSELLFRGQANQYGSGYAINTLLDEAKKALGPGSWLALDKSRLASISEAGTHALTLIARGRRFAMWIDGREVMDAYDSRPEGTYHAAAGPIAFLLANERATLQVSAAAAAALPAGPEPPPAPAAKVTPPPPVQAAAAPASVPAIAVPAMAGESPEDKARQDQVRSLTVQALEAQSPEEAARINKQILVLDPSDMPAQQRLDKAQAQLDTKTAVEQHALDLRIASATKLEQNTARRDTLMQQAESALLQGRTNEARDRLDDAKRLGASGPEVDHLQTIIHARIRNRILLWSSLGAAALLAFIAGLIAWRRSRRQVLVGYLIALDGAEKGRRYLLNQDVIHVGGVAMDAAKKNEVIVRDPDRLVSRFHLEVHKRRNTYYVIDLDSSNGSFLNGRRLQAGAATRLRDGDRLGLAKSASFALHLERN